MKKLYESLLDDEDIIIKSTDKTLKQKRKEDIISFISQNYMLTMGTKNREVDITKHIKINKDWTVDVKMPKTPHSYTCLYAKNKLNKKGELPINGFTWGKIWNLLIYCLEAEHLCNLPKECNSLHLEKCSKLKSLTGLNMKINNSLTINSAKELTHITNMNIGDDIINIGCYYMDNLEIVENLPKNINNRLTFYNCPKLWKLSPANTNTFFCQHCDSLTDDEIHKINYRTLHKL